MKETMKVKNPLSDFWASKNGGRLSELEASAVFIGKFLEDLGKEYAVDEKLNKIKLGEEGAEHYNVDKVGGFWRIQRKCPYKITRVRDKDMILLNKLNHVENTLFEFWTAIEAVYNCYGILLHDMNYNYIVAKYDTDKETYMGYGYTLEEARAFLGLKLYDEYKDLINSVACRNKLKGK